MVIKNGKMEKWKNGHGRQKKIRAENDEIARQYR